MRSVSRVRRKTIYNETVLHSRSPEETERVGYELAGSLPVPAVVLLCGSLGTGKTTLARGLAFGLGLENPESVHSPSFTIVNEYRGRCPIYHVDLYRLGGLRDLDSVGLDDFLGKEGVTIVEWGERLNCRQDAALVVELEDAGGEARILRVLEAQSGAHGVEVRSHGAGTLRRNAGKAKEKESGSRRRKRSRRITNE